LLIIPCFARHFRRDSKVTDARMKEFQIFSEKSCDEKTPKAFAFGVGHSLTGPAIITALAA